jgi:hypothetical protein
MAYTKASLSARIKAKLIARFGTPENDTWLTGYCDDIAEACDEELSQAVVTVPNVTSGSSTAIGTVT